MGHKQRKAYTAEFKREAVRLLGEKEGQLKLKEIAKSLGISGAMLSRWRTELQGRPAALGAERVREAEEPLSREALEQENKRLRKQVARLEEDCTILKKATAFFAAHEKE